MAANISSTRVSHQNIEILVTELLTINKCKSYLPFPMAQAEGHTHTYRHSSELQSETMSISQNVRLTNRILDLRV